MNTDTSARVGKVKFFNVERSFGFISPDTGEPDVFVPVSQLMDSGLGTLVEGQKVSFESRQDKRGRGLQAFNLKLID